MTAESRQQDVIVEFMVAARECPEGEWEPYIERNQAGQVVGLFLAPPNPFATGDERLLRTGYRCPLGSEICERHGSRIVAKKEVIGEIVRCRLVRVPLSTLADH